MEILGFIICAAVIFFAGSKLSFYGDIISELSGMGRAWFGLIMMSAVTSLPELSVGIGSVAITGNADLAVGDVLGSCAFNLAILACMDIFVPKNKPLLSNVATGHVIACGLSMILITIAGISLFIPKDYYLMNSLGIMSILIIVIYIISVRIIYNFELKSKPNEEPQQHLATITLKKAVLYYILFALVVIGAALFLPYFAEVIAEKTGLGTSFVGTLFLAMSTSLPEIAVTIASVRRGAIDMAVGNMLGSNIFNILILAIDDIFYAKGILLNDASDIHLLSVLCTLIMTAIAIIGLVYKPSSKRFVLAWDTFLILIVFAFNLVMLYHLNK